MLQCSDEKQQMKQSFCIFHLTYLILGLVPIEECSFLDRESSVVEAKDAQANLRCSDVEVIVTQIVLPSSPTQ